MARSFKRDKKGRFAKTGTATKARKELKRKKSTKKKYKGRGGYARAIDDYSNSRGYYAKNARGKNISKARKKYRKVNGTVSKASVAYQVSKRRGKKKKR